MKDKELWLKKLKEKLENYSEPTPDSGWEQLEKELSASDWNTSLLVKEPATKRIHPYRPWSVAVAAAVLVALSLVGLYFLDTPEAETVRQLSSVSVPDELPEQVTPHTIDEPGKVMEVVRPVKQVLAADKKVIATDIEEHVVTVEVGNNDLPTEQADVNEPTQPTSEHKKKTTTQPVEKRTNGFTSNRDRNLALSTSRKKKGGNWSVGMGVGGLNQISLPDTGVDGDLNGSSDMFFNPIYSDNALGAVAIPHDSKFSLSNGGVPHQQKVSVVDTKHKQSFSFGLSVRKELTKEFSLETGLTYTLLSSEILTTGSTGWRDQKLHYIGIPLRAGWNFYQKERVTFYTSAGGAVEKCVAGKLGDEKQVVDEFQFSVGGSLGVQLNLSKRVGLYAEPGVTYYFDDGSNVETIRKEKPFGFSLQAGIRLNY